MKIQIYFNNGMFETTIKISNDAYISLNQFFKRNKVCDFGNGLTIDFSKVKEIKIKEELDNE